MLVWPILCIPESYKDWEERISPTLHSQSEVMKMFYLSFASVQSIHTFYLLYSLKGNDNYLIDLPRKYMKLTLVLTKRAVSREKGP